MSTFKERKTTADRSAPDRRRHKQKIEKAIREGIHNIVAEESIIGQDGKKKIKIPVRGIKEYRFVYGDNKENRKVGSAHGIDKIKRGQQIGEARNKAKAKGDKPGEDAGEEYYDVEITLEELAAYLFDSLELPDLEKKTLKKLLSEKVKRHGYRSQGIRPRLDKKQTLIKKIKRKKAAIRAGTFNPESDDRFLFHENDLRYRHIKKTMKESSSAVVVFLMDISGSMTTDKKYLARSFFFLLYQFIRHRYENIEIVFIAHDVQAYEVNEDQFFNRGNSGGTMVSPALEMANDIINKRYHPNSWNVYLFHCSDGDNWPSDMSKAVKLSSSLKEICQLYGYCEINPSGDRLFTSSDSTLSQAYDHLNDDKFKTTHIQSKDDIWPSFKDFFGGKIGV